MTSKQTLSAITKLNETIPLSLVTKTPLTYMFEETNRKNKSRSKYVNLISCIYKHMEAAQPPFLVTLH